MNTPTHFPSPTVPLIFPSHAHLFEGNSLDLAMY